MLHDLLGTSEQPYRATKIVASKFHVRQTYEGHSLPLRDPPSASKMQRLRARSTHNMENGEYFIWTVVNAACKAICAQIFSALLQKRKGAVRLDRPLFLMLYPER
ncbi:MAG: hypothetical protein DWH74_03800 [Planctomycetota bacterium]|nr:MAG: hypothetical protein DWH74_03800 [Planctomycetota bacterium]